jgi:hypothetical protein
MRGSETIGVWRLAFGVWRLAFGVWRSAFGEANRREAPGGEPLYLVCEDFATFVLSRLWPRRVTSRRLPRMTQRSAALEILETNLGERKRTVELIHRAG